MAQTITFNEQQSFQLIYTTTGGGTVFSANRYNTTAFDYFANNAVVNDAIYLGMSNGAAFSDIQFTIGTALVATSITVAWEKWNGSAWVAVTGLTDNTNAFRNSGVQTVTFPVFKPYGKVINGSSNNTVWVRCRITAVSGITEGGANATTVVKNRDWAVTIANPGATTSGFCNAAYAADVAGGWGVVTRVGTKAYNFACHLKVGYSTDANITTISDTDVAITIDGLPWAQKGQSIIQLGNLIDETKKTTSLGCYISCTRNLHSFWSDGTGAEKWILYSTVSNLSHYILYKAYNSTLNGAFHGTSCLIYNVSYNAVPDFTGHTQDSGASVVGVRILGTGTSNGMRIEFSDYMRDFILSGCSYSGYDGAGSTNLDYDNVTINMISDGTGVYWTVTPTDPNLRGIYVSRQHTMNLNISANSVPIQNARITLTDGNGYNAAYKQEGTALAFSRTATSITLSSSSAVVGSKLRLGSEKVTCDSGTYPTFNVTRNIEGTVAGHHTSNTHIVQRCFPVVLSDASGNSGEILVESQQEKWASGTNPGVTTITSRNPFILGVKKYGYLDISQNMTIQGTSTDSGAVKSSIGLIVDPVITKTEANASLITGISVNHSAQTITITSNTSIEDLYDYIHYDINQGENPLFSTPFTSSDGINFTSSYDIILNGGNLTGTGTINMTGNTFTRTSNETSSVTINHDAGTFTSISVSNIVSGSRMRIWNETDNAEIANEIISGTTYSTNFSYTSPKTIWLYLTYVNGTSAKIPYSSSNVIGSSGLSFLASQEDDTVYNGNAIDGSSITYFTADYPNIQVDISSGTVFSPKQLYAWFQYIQTTANGIRYFFGGIDGLDEFNYVIKSDVVDLQLDNTSGGNIVMSGGYLSRDDGASYIYISSANSIIPMYDRAYIADSDSLIRLTKGLYGK